MAHIFHITLTTLSLTPCENKLAKTYLATAEILKKKNGGLDKNGKKQNAKTSRKY